MEGALERYQDREEITDFREIYRLPNLIQIALEKKKVASIDKIVDFEKERIKRAARKKLREKSESAAKGAADYVFGKKYGPKVYNRVYDINTYRLVKTLTENHLQGYSQLDFIEAEYGSPELTDENGGKLFGKFKGKNRKAHIIKDPKKALGSYHQTLKEKTGFTEGQIGWAVKEYVKAHENAEFGLLKYTLRERLSEDEHGKLEAYLLKSLYNSNLPGAKEIYAIGSLIDSMRTDEFGKNTRKYLAEGI